MNKEEIDKILSRLERIDHKEYSCSFEFADSGSFKETCMCFDERKKLANYIKDLQQENKQLKEVNEQHRILNGELRTTINKAIEMFESDEHFEDGCYCEEIEKILRGTNE